MHYKKNVFSYLIKKIENSDFTKDPFKHIYIENFFKKSHFDEIIKSLEIKCIYSVLRLIFLIKFLN